MSCPCGDHFGLRVLALSFPRRTAARSSEPSVRLADHSGREWACPSRWRSALRVGHSVLRSHWQSECHLGEWMRELGHEGRRLGPPLPCLTTGLALVPSHRLFTSEAKRATTNMRGQSMRQSSYSLHSEDSECRVSFVSDDGRLELVQIDIAPAHRRLGEARQLLDWLLSVAGDRHICVSPHGLTDAGSQWVEACRSEGYQLHRSQCYRGRHRSRCVCGVER